jgi:hypothetical protein
LKQVGIDRLVFWKYHGDRVSARGKFFGLAGHRVGETADFGKVQVFTGYNENIHDYP